MQKSLWGIMRAGGAGRGLQRVPADGKVGESLGWNRYTLQLTARQKSLFELLLPLAGSPCPDAY